jgi:hypothetical protein
MESLSKGIDSLRELENSSSVIFTSCISDILVDFLQVDSVFFTAIDMRELDPLVSEYQHDKHRPREAEALLMLRKIASLVKPIMRQRAWRVGTLCEFYPQQRNLLGLNVNAGQKICLRLRYPSDERQFLPLEQVVDTMLHE